LTFRASGLPTGLAIAPSTGVVTGTPSNPGSYSVTISVSDGHSTATRSFSWTIESPGSGGGVNEPPTVAALGGQASTVGQAVSLAVQASDPEGAALSFSASGLPPGLAIAPATGVISGAPSTVGSFGVTVSVSDGTSTTIRSFSWAVAAASTAQSGTVWTAAGQGLEFMRYYSGDGGPALAATFTWAQDAVVDSAGNMYVADMHGHRVRRVDKATGLVSTVVGTGSPGSGGDGGPGTAAELNRPINLTVDAGDKVYIADWDNGRVRRYDPATGVVTTVAGGGPPGAFGDGVAATSVWLQWPEGMDLDAAGNLYIAEFAANRVRRVDAATGIITTVAGRGHQASDGDGGSATTAGIFGPTSVRLDAAGNLYITDYYGNRLRFVDRATGIISTLAGDGQEGFAGDGGPATASRLYHPITTVFDFAKGYVYVGDAGNGRIRRIDNLGRGTIVTVAGGGTSRADGETALATSVSATSLWFDRPSGDLYYAEPYYTAVRRVVGLVS
jgi:hypothetical protein